MVGIVFAKMARPKQRKQTLLFSRNCVICQRDGCLCLLFRVGDMREKSHLINATIRLYLIQSKHTQEGEVLTPYLQELTVSKSDIMILSLPAIAHYLLTHFRFKWMTITITCSSYGH